MFRVLVMCCFLIRLQSGLAQDFDVNHILELNASAQGGNTAHSQIENVRFRLNISEPGFKVSGTYVATRQGDMRIDVETDGQPVFSEGLFEGRAWQWAPNTGVEPQDEASAAALRHGIELPGRFFTLLQARDRGATVTLLDSVTDNGATQWQLRLVLPDGFSRDYFIDKESHRVVRERDHRAFHPAVDSTRVTVETRFDEPAWVNGVLHYLRSENRNPDNGEWLGTTDVMSVEHNMDLDEGYFDPGVK